MAELVRIEGLRELDRALGELPKSVGKSVARKVLKKRGKPIADAAKAKAPVDPDGGGQLRDSIGVSTKLSPRQRRLQRKIGRDDVEMFVGAGPLAHAHLNEFGLGNNPPRPFMRPAWDERRRGVIDGIGDDLWKEIDKAAKRQAARAARLR
jgi:HK97 gp10 family phage protein